MLPAVLLNDDCVTVALPPAWMSSGSANVPWPLLRSSVWVSVSVPVAPETVTLESTSRQESLIVAGKELI